MRQTRQKDLILQTVRRLPGHPSAEEVYSELIQEMPSISLATVYRNLNDFVRQGKLKKLELPSQPARFDNMLNEHFHGICEHCHRLIDFDLSHLDAFVHDLETQVERRTGFKASQTEIIIHGVCEDCQQAEESARAEESAEKPRSSRLFPYASQPDSNLA